jgi:glycosyltransferase involved in cell wall biosynthesis
MNSGDSVMEIAWHGSFSAGQGYSGSSEQTALAIDALPQFDLYCVPFGVQREVPKKNISDHGFILLGKRKGNADIGVAHGFPVDFPTIQGYKYRVGYTMFETDTLPKGHSDWINQQLDLLITPSKFCVNMFRRNGVTIPIEIVHNGVNSYTYQYIDRPVRKQYTFLIMGTLTIRKNSGSLISAFIELFKDNPDVRLIVKTQSGTHGHMQFDKALGDITIIDKPYTEKQMHDLIAEADCFVFPSRGEGFGMPPIEAMATGIPAIIADNTGMKEYTDLLGAISVRSDARSKAEKYPPKWGDVGQWYEPDYEGLKKAMQHVYDKRESYRDKSKLIAQETLSRFNYGHVAYQFSAAIAKHFNG